MNQLQLNFDQKSELARVTAKTSMSIVEYFGKLKVGDTFHAQELRDYVAALVHVAPASPDRIMRELRKRGVLNYEVVNRRESLYRKLG